MKNPPIFPLVSVFLVLLSLPLCVEAGSGSGGGNGGGNGGGGHNVGITISPTSAQLSTGQTQQFTASVSGTRYKSVVWSVNGTAGGNATVGTVSSLGMYTAPAVAPGSPVQVTATSTYYQYGSASATVSISSISPSASTVSLTVSPTSASVPLGGTQQFSATVSGTSNTSVSWLVNGNAGGSSTVGTISSAGIYAAPNTMPTTSVIVEAQSAAQPATTQSANVQLIAPSVSVSISPTSASVEEGKTQQFAAQVSGTSYNTAVNWLVSGVAGGNATLGTVSSSGLYTAPGTVPSGSVVVTAQSAASPSNSANAAVTVLAHSVDLSWAPSSSSVAGYNLYRSTQPAGPFTKLNSSVDTATVYTDSSVLSGQTYYYAATSIDSNGVESSYSNIAQATIP